MDTIHCHGVIVWFTDCACRLSLALAELYMTIASFVRRFDMELYETTMENIRIYRELGIGQPKEGDFSVRAKITNVIKE